jgi:hypothetical protein
MQTAHAAAFDADHPDATPAGENRSGRAQWDRRGMTVRCAAESMHMAIAVPASLKALHESLHATLKRATREPGRTGEAARKLIHHLERQFAREEEFALPALALLPALSRGEVAPDQRDAVRLVDQLSDERASLLEAYRGIRVELRAFAGAAEAEGKPEYLDLIEDLVMYARLAEEVLYPAALLAAAFIRREDGQTKP